MNPGPLLLIAFLCLLPLGMFGAGLLLGLRLARRGWQISNPFKGQGKTNGPKLLRTH